MDKPTNNSPLDKARDAMREVIELINKTSGPSPQPAEQSKAHPPKLSLTSDLAL